MLLIEKVTTEKHINSKLLRVIVCKVADLLISCLKKTVPTQGLPLYYMFINRG